MQSFLIFSLLVSLAGRALAFTTLIVGGTNLSTTDILTIPNSAVMNACTSNNCSSVQQTLQNCNGDTTCQCAADVVASLVSCEYCMFIAAIDQHAPVTDPREINTNVVAGFYNACTTALTTSFTAAPQTAFKLPSNWDGPHELDLGLGGTVIGVAITTFLAVSAILILSNL